MLKSTVLQRIHPIAGERKETSRISYNLTLACVNQPPYLANNHHNISLSFPNDLHKLHPALPVHLRPHSKRHLHPAPQVRALPLYVSEHGDVFAVRERRLDVEFQTRPVLSHVAEGLRDGIRARVSDGGVSPGALLGLGDVPGGVVYVSGLLERVGRGLVGWIELYQCGQRKVASEVVRGVIAAADRSVVVRRVRTGDVLDGFGIEVGAGAEVGWLVG